MNKNSSFKSTFSQVVLNEEVFRRGNGNQSEEQMSTTMYQKLIGQLEAIQKTNKELVRVMAAMSKIIDDLRKENIKLKNQLDEREINIYDSPEDFSDNDMDFDSAMEYQKRKTTEKEESSNENSGKKSRQTGTIKETVSFVSGRTRSGKTNALIKITKANMAEMLEGENLARFTERSRANARFTCLYDKDNKSLIMKEAPAPENGIFSDTNH